MRVTKAPRRLLGGFTLIELLVVITIIAVLTAILFPVFVKARGSAQTATCISNIKQLLQASQIYCNDHDRRLVPARVWDTSHGTLGVTWCVLLQPQLSNKEVLTCPLDPAPQTARNSTDLPHSYGINYSLTYLTGYGHEHLARSMSSLERVSDLILFFDMKSEAGAMGSSYMAHRLSRVAFRHDDKASFGFLDGHAKSLGVKEVNDGKYWIP